jgi:hypothetical protein
MRGATRDSQNHFYNNSGSYVGAIVFYRQQLHIGGKHTNFTNNQGRIVGAAALLEGTMDTSVAKSISQELFSWIKCINLDGTYNQSTFFLDNISIWLVRTGITL